MYINFYQAFSYDPFRFLVFYSCPHFRVYYVLKIKKKLNAYRDEMHQKMIYSPNYVKMTELVNFINPTYYRNGFIITWILHQIIMYFNEVKLVAGHPICIIPSPPT